MRVSQTNSRSLFPPVIAKEYGIWMTSSAALIICSLVLEIHQPALGFKFGNIAFFFACLMIVRVWLLRMREAVQPCVYLPHVLLSCMGRILHQLLTRAE